MIKIIECEKSCLKADKGKMLFNSNVNVYTPKAYLYSEAEAAEWSEVDEAAAVLEEEISAEDSLLELMEVLA